MAAGVPAVAAELAKDDPGLYPPVERVWADWLYGEHSPPTAAKSLTSSPPISSMAFLVFVPRCVFSAQ